MPTLQFFEGEVPLFSYRLKPGRTSIGRADGADIALPGETVSRTHCFIEAREGDWVVIDRSRHGLTVDGAPCKRAVLHDGARLGIGPYTALLVLADTEARPTAMPRRARSHEQLLDVGEGLLAVQRAELEVVRGPSAGARIPLKSARLSVGAPGSDVVIEDDRLAQEHALLRVSRGRVMVEPAAGAVYLNGERLRAITPVYEGEEIHVGQTVLRVTVGIDEESPSAKRFGEMVGHSRVMQILFGTLRRVSSCDYPVLVLGESGTGKELTARGIHEHSARCGMPFVAVNCGAIAANLFESELFGHEKGAFTGAERRKDGAFHQADGGTLFLDEIGELPEEAQAKLLRALESGEVRRVGSVEVGYPDVRVVAATNRDLAEAVRRGTFREDLFFRLAVLSVSIPPLRDRPGDIPHLCRVLGRTLHPELHVSEGAMTALLEHRWPGNVRELRNVLTRAYVMGGPRIERGALSFHDLATRAPGPPADAASSSLHDAEKAYIVEVLARNDDNRSAAARELGIARSSLQYKMRRYGLM